MTAKNRIAEILQDLPDDVSFENALYELYVTFKIEKGLEQADRGEGITQEDARQRFAEWLK